MATKIKRITRIPVGEFFANHGKQLHLSLVGKQVGFDRYILEPSVNRPGLALAGFFDYFAYKRIQVLGNSEFAYLEGLAEEETLQHFKAMCAKKVPCLVVARGKELSPKLVAAANRAGIAVFRTTMSTMKFINSATLWLEWDFAPTTTVHGCMVDVRGIGVLICGASGTGKSETTLGLIQRGHSLVADDIVLFRAPEGRELIGTSKELGRCHMEVRGMGMVNIVNLFGIGAVRLEKRLDLVVTLVVAPLNEMERIGAKQETFSLLGAKIPHVRLPVAPGRDMVSLVEVAALEQKMRGIGLNSATEFSKKLLKFMRANRNSGRPLA